MVAKKMTKKTEQQLVGEEVIRGKPKGEANWFKPKKGSVFPARGKLVKTMAFDTIVKWVGSVFCHGASATTTMTKSPCLSQPRMLNSKKCKQIVPL